MPPEPIEDRPAGEDRGDFYDRSAEFTGMLMVETAAGTFLVSTAGGTPERDLFAQRAASRQLTLRRTLAALDPVGQLAAATAGVLIDVGAGIGALTVPAVGQYGFSGAICFEPEPRDHLLLRLNCVLNGIGDVVELHDFLPSGRDGETSLDNVIRDNRLDLGRAGLLCIAAPADRASILFGASELLRTGVPIVLEDGRGLLERHGPADELLELLDGTYAALVRLPAVDADLSLGAKRFRRSALRPIEELAHQVDAEGDDATGVLILAER
jgi:hypothetical protein